MIDIHLLVYSGALPVFILAALIPGILMLLVFTAVAVLSPSSAAANRQFRQVPAGGT